MRLTLLQLHRLPWKLCFHIDGEICVSVYVARIGFYLIRRERHTKRIDDFEYGKTITKYRFNGRTYRSHKSVVEAINRLIDHD